jgi:hypothetical protein
VAESSLELARCKQCSSEKLGHFNGEIAIHFPGLKGLDKPIVWVFTELSVCLDCGFTNFTVPDKELRVLVEGASAFIPTAKAPK